MRKSIQLNQTSLYDEAELRLKELLNVKEAILKSIASGPEGKIHIIRKNQATQYYIRKVASDRSGKYLSKSESVIIRRYLQKAYYEKAIKLVDSEIVTLEKIVSCSHFFQNMVELYSGYPEEIREFVTPLACSDEEFARMWMSEKFEGKRISEETPTFITNHGERVRSKSELTIANALAAKGIPYRYECPLVLASGAVIYPDFTALNVRERRVKYWEHRGMMDDRGYSRDAVERVKELNRNGIVLGKNLIITEETSSSPLNTTEIDSMIKNYLI